MVYIDGSDLSFNEIERVLIHGERVELTQEALKNIRESRELVDKVAKEEQIVYGVTTGFGKFSETVISCEDLQALQQNLILSHATAVGEPFSTEIVRGIMLFRVNSLAKGYSGICLKTIRLLVDMINAGVHPVIPSQGSLGASGDLAPLAHMVLVMIGKGEAYYKGDRVFGARALEMAELESVTLSAKEGLALINGTQAISAVGAYTWIKMRDLLKTADITAAMTIDALEGITSAFDDRIYQLRKHPGLGETAVNLRTLLEDSEIIANRQHKRVQDAYTLRCIPQIHGASKDAHRHVGDILTTEINSTTDNPLVFSESGEFISGGNFHGQPLALPMDYLSTAISELANVSERRIERLVNPQLNMGLPAFLIENGGLSSGFMIAQYTAASLVSENKSLAHPASVDSIPSSANQEDHVSMGTIGARKALDILENTAYVLAVELLVASQALDLRKPYRAGKGTRPALELVREHVSFLDTDRELKPDIERCRELILSGQILYCVEEQVGQLK